jgi:hypothetical protein
VTSANYPFTDARCIGAPLPGALVKLVLVEDAYEIRVQGPQRDPGLLRPPRPHRRGVRRRRLLPHGRRRRLRRPRRPGTRAWSSAAASRRTSSWARARSSGSARSAPRCFLPSPPCPTP